MFKHDEWLILVVAGVILGSVLLLPNLKHSRLKMPERKSVYQSCTDTGLYYGRNYVIKCTVIKVRDLDLR